MNSEVIEWCFKCDEASERANELFDKVMNRTWLLERGIDPFDSDAAWEEVRKQLFDLRERCVLTVIRIGEPNLGWNLFITNLTGGSER